MTLIRDMLRWPRIAWVASRGLSRRHGPKVRARNGLPPWRQRAQQLRFALVHGVPPRSYYLFRLYEPKNRRRAGRYLHRAETKRGVYVALNSALRRDREPADTRPAHGQLNRKHRFHELCRAADLPTVPLLFIVRKKRLERIEATRFRLPGIDLVLKPLCGRGGTGVERWDLVSRGVWSNPVGRAVDEEALWAHWFERAQGRAMLVQPRVRNHPDTEVLSSGALATVRVMTALDERGRPEVTHATFRMSVGSVVVDNMHKGGLGSAVDVATGTLGRGTTLEPASEWVDTHPVTGVLIPGRVLPYWSDVLRLAGQAHRVFSDFVVVGWDIGITENGPIIIEGNSGADVNVIQRPQDAPIGDTRLGELMAFHAARAEVQVR